MLKFAPLQDDTCRCDTEVAPRHTNCGQLQCAMSVIISQKCPGHVSNALDLERLTQTTDHAVVIQFVMSSNEVALLVGDTAICTGIKQHSMIPRMSQVISSALITATCVGTVPISHTSSRSTLLTPRLGWSNWFIAMQLSATRFNFRSVTDGLFEVIESIFKRLDAPKGQPIDLTFN